MRRGDIYAAAARGAYTGMPRSVVVQDDRFDGTAPVTVCPMTTNPVEAPLTRIEVEPSTLSGLSEPTRVTVDKVTTMPRDNVRDHLGRLSDTQLLRVDRALIVFLGLAE